MHFLVIGASGRTGTLILDQALSKGHTITALVRTPAALPPRAGLTLIRGTPHSQSDVNKTFAAAATPFDAVLVALSARRTSDSPFAAPASPPRFIADSVAHLVAAMHAHAVARIVVMSAVGVGDSWPALNFLMKGLVRWSGMAAGYVDHNCVDREVRESGLEWVLVRPVMLGEGEAREVKDWGDRGAGSGFMPRVARASVARFMVEAAEGSGYVRRSPVISE